MVTTHNIYKILNKIWTEIFVILLTVMFVSVNTEDCGQEEWTQCSRPLQILKATSDLSFVTKKEELDQLCPDLNAGLNCIRSYTRRCMNIHQREHFNKLYQGTSEVIHDLCKEGSYQEDFLRHAPCMRHVRKEFEVCSNQYQTTITRIGQSASDSSQHQLRNLSQLAIEQEIRREMCCSFTEYIECSERVVRHTCGPSTANFTRKFLDKMSRNLISMHCEDYRNKTGKCGKVKSSTSSHMYQSSTTIFAWMASTILLILITREISINF